jgi:hypothetical protein
MAATALRLHCILPAISASVKSVSRNNMMIRFSSFSEKYFPCDLITSASCLVAPAQMLCRLLIFETIELMRDWESDLVKATARTLPDGT